MGKIVRTLFIIILLVMAASVGIDALYRHIYKLPYPWPRNIWILPEIKDKFKLVLVGNSHADEGITFAGYNIKTLTLTDPAQSFDYELANLKMHARQINKGAAIIIDVSQISFSQRTYGREDSFQTMYYDGRLSPFLIPHLKIEDYIQSQIFPFLRTGYVWRQKYNDQIRERISAEERWVTPTPTPTSTPTAAPALTAKVGGENYFQVRVIQHELSSPSADSDKRLEGSLNFIFEKWYRTGGFGPQYFEQNRKDLEQLIAYCQQMKWRPVLITIPISKVLQVGLLPDFMQVYVYDNITKTNLHGADYVDFTRYDQLTRDTYLFRDSDHLNGKGATILSYLLLRYLVDKGYLPSSADGYDYTSM